MLRFFVLICVVICYGNAFGEGFWIEQYPQRSVTSHTSLRIPVDYQTSEWPWDGPWSDTVSARLDGDGYSAETSATQGSSLLLLRRNRILSIEGESVARTSTAVTGRRIGGAGSYSELHVRFTASHEFELRLDYRLGHESNPLTPSNASAEIILENAHGRRLVDRQVNHGFPRASDSLYIRCREGAYTLILTASASRGLNERSGFCSTNWYIRLRANLVEPLVRPQPTGF